MRTHSGASARLLTVRSRRRHRECRSGRNHVRGSGLSLMVHVVGFRGTRPSFRRTPKNKESKMKGFNYDYLLLCCNTPAQSKTSADISLVIFAQLQSVFGCKQDYSFHTLVAKLATVELRFHSRLVLFSLLSPDKVPYGS